jgi:hypothetical protein
MPDLMPTPDQDSAFRSGAFQQFRIADPIQTGLLGRHEVNRGLAPPDGLDDSEFEVVVCLEENAQERRSP